MSQLELEFSKRHTCACACGAIIFLVLRKRLRRNFYDLRCPPLVIFLVRNILGFISGPHKSQLDAVLPTASRYPNISSKSIHCKPNGSGLQAQSTGRTTLTRKNLRLKTNILFMNEIIFLLFFTLPVF